MNNNKNLKTSISLNDAFDLISKIFNEERTYYENTINSLKEKVSKLEDSLIQLKKDNMNYQEKISKLKGKIHTISKTVSKLEEGEFEIKIDNNNNLENNRLNNNIESKKQHHAIKYRNTNTINSFRKQTKIFSEMNKSTSINIKSNNNFINMDFLDKNKINNNLEDISRNYNKKTHKKSISTKIKNNILNIDQHISQAKRRNEYNNMFKSHCYNDEDVSLLIINNENELENKMTLSEEKNKKINEKRKVNCGGDKYNKIEQKIKGLKSTLSIYSYQDNPNYNDNFIILKENLMKSGNK